jgi:hypothetical protein
VAGRSAGASDVGSFSVGSTTTFSASGVASGTYYVRIVAINAAGTSAPSNEVVVVVP